ncbi:30S ribosomal protein S20 [Patescibacteria group bacterium]|nr:30S ribosomal protein S20 [Patescibacteria group bacterium]MBU1931089.1 30S ribosomal protein S20 [Patescibacteria group bacterium]
MPITSSAKKALRGSQRKRLVNQRYWQKMRQLIKALRKNPDAKALPAIFRTLDQAAKKNVIHSKKADRLKARLSQLVNKTKPVAKKI